MTLINRKVCLLGDFAVGKTSLVRRFVYGMFDETYASTTGVKVSRKTVAIPQAQGIVEMTMMLWDVAGTREYAQMRTSYLRNVTGAILVCDVTRPETLKSLHVYAETLYGMNPGVRLILAANKRDQVDQHKLTRGQIEDAAAALNGPFYLTSAKTGDRVDALFRHLGRLLLL